MRIECTRDAGHAGPGARRRMQNPEAPTVAVQDLALGQLMKKLELAAAQIANLDLASNMI